MKVTVTDGTALGAAEIARWREIQAADPDFASPYLSPEYHLAAAASRPGIRFAILEDGNRIEGFFPHQIVDGGIAEAVGDKISDCHAVIVSPKLPWTVDALLRGAGISAWHYRHLIISQSQFAPFHTELFHSPLIDLSQGFDAYAAAKQQAGSHVLTKVAALQSKFEQACGPLRYEPQSTDLTALHWLLHCKSAQYNRTGKPDRFAIPWVVALLERLQATHDPDFAGMLSILWAGDRIAAAHFGMRSSTIWNYWFPCYDRQFAAFSPGLILLTGILRTAAEMGLQTVELGAGLGDYKTRFATSERILARGVATL